jgi:hypothetical protein
MMGYCTVCERLVQISAKSYIYGGRKVWVYAPVEHDAEGKRCKGVGKAI